MKVKMISPAKTAPQSRHWRSIKYSLFPPLGLATLAGYLDPGDDVTLQDEHVETLDLDDSPDLVVIEAYITSARRAYAYADHYRARGAHVCLGGLHPTSLPREALAHADTVFLGPGEDTWPAFLEDLRRGRPQWLYQSTRPTLEGAPRPRRDLINRALYLVPNSLVVSRGCPHSCDFCYKDAFFRGCPSFFVQPLEAALAQVESLPGRHLYFLDDNLFGHPRFAARLFAEMCGMGRIWQAAGTVQGVLRPGLLEVAVKSGLRSLFIGLETLSATNLRAQHKMQNLGDGRPPYEAAIRRLHEHGVMVNASFVFGMDDDDPDVFERTVEWALQQGIETATFHILTPYPGTRLFHRLQAQGRITTHDWDRYDTRHAVFRPARMSAETLEAGYRRACSSYYRWGAIAKAAGHHPDLTGRLRHFTYAAGWKKLEPLWDALIRGGRVQALLPLLEAVLDRGGRPHGGAVARAEGIAGGRAIGGGLEAAARAGRPT